MQGRLLELDGEFEEAARAFERAAEGDPEAVEIRRQLAQVYLHLEDLPKALEQAEIALGLDPGDEPSRRALAMLYVTDERPEAAVELLEPLYMSGGLTTDGLYGLFTLYLQIERYADARGVAEKLIELDPLDHRGYFASAATYEEEGDLEASEAAYRRGIRQLPDDPRLYDAASRMWARAEDSERELLILEEKLRRYPDDIGAMRRIAELEDKAGNRDAAVRMLERLISVRPDQLNARFQLGYYYFEAGREDEAIASFNQVLEQSEDLRDTRRAHEVRYILGRVYYGVKDSDSALKVLGEIPDDSERFADARVVMARLLEEREDFGAALDEARRAMERAPENRELVAYTAGLLQRSGDLSAAVDVMDKLIASKPDDAAAYYDLGLIYGSAGDEVQAVKSMELAIERDKDHASALNYVGYSWADSGQKLEQAEAYVRRAVELRPNDGYITDSLGWVHYQRGLKALGAGEAEDARASFEEAVRQLELANSLLKDGDPVITQHLGDAYRSVSRFKDALRTYRTALSFEPEPEDAEEIRRQIELLELQLGLRGKR